MLTVLLSLLFLAALERRDPYFFQTDDNSDLYLPWYTLNHRTLRDTGELALVNWHQNLGQPHFAHGLSGVLYLPNYLFSWLSIELSRDPLAMMDWLSIAHLVVGTALLYLLLRAHDCGVGTAVAGALCGLTLPFVIGVSRIWISIPVNYCFLALSLLCLKQLEGNPWRRPLGFYAFGRALFILHGNVQFVAFTAVFELVFLATLCVAQRRLQLRLMVAWAAGNVIAALLALPVLWEMWQAQRWSVRDVALGAEVSMRSALPLGPFLAAQLGRFEYLTMEYSSQIAFIGVTFLAFALLGWALRRAAWRDALPWLATAAAAAILVMGWVSIFDLPVFNRFRWPFKFLLYAGWFSTIGVVIMASRLERRGALRPRLAVVLLSLVVAVQVAVNFRAETFRAFANRRVDDLSQLLADRIPVEGRVMALAPEDANACNLFTYNFASLSGHLSVVGFDPIISRDLWNATPAATYAGFVTRPLDATLMDWMVEHGVRFLFAIRTSEMEAKLDAVPNLRQFLRSGRWLVYRLEKTNPLALLKTADGRLRDCSTRIRGNIMEVDTGSEIGRVALNIFPLPNLRYRVDGEAWRSFAKPDTPVVNLDRPTAKLEVTIAVPSLRWTVPVSLVALAGCAWLILRRSSDPVPDQPS